jgi:hypothetical protein
MEILAGSGENSTLLLIDRIDESWDGSDKAVILLMALMHACVELSASTKCVRPLLFLRENVFERVRLIDKEFARLETFVTSLGWSKELLVELVERRLNVPLIAKFPLHGPTWAAFFEDAARQSSQEIVFSYCQYRPRDVLVYCSFAIETAQSHLREKVFLEDLLTARRRFSDSRLKDLCDEYSENYTQLQLVLGRFYGLGSEFTVQGLDDFIKKLLVDEEIKRYCKSWIYKYSQPHLFIQLLYDIGFVGIKEDGLIHYRSLGPQSTTPPPIGMSTTVLVHPTYREALNLQNVLISSLDPRVALRESGVIGDLPGGIDISEYQTRLAELREQLKTIPEGDSHAEEFASLVGEILKLCFYRSLTNLEPKVGSVDGRVIRDWIAANHAQEGFWELIRQKYGATQIIFECKNYSDLQARDFHQISYYMNDTIGRFGIIVSRSTEVKRHYGDHIKRIASEKNGMVLIFGERDLGIFLRQAVNGKSNESHLQEIYDRTVREVS